MKPALVCLLLLCSATTALSQATCPVAKPEPLTDAGKLARAHKYAEAEQLYRAKAEAAAKDDEESYAAAMTGLSRVLLSQHKDAEAMATASNGLQRYPQNPHLLDALGEALFRRGETGKAAETWNASLKVDPCIPRTHFDAAMYLHLNAQYASEQKQLDLAHRLAPKNNNYERIARAVTNGPPSLEDRIDRITERLQDTSLSPADRASAERTLQVLQAQSKGSCEIVRPVESATIPIVPIANGPVDMYAAGLDVSFNGKKRRMELDTGASGLLLTRSVAKAAGLIDEATSAGYGIGDGGLQKEVLAHVDDIKIGPLEFHNCLVRIMDKSSQLDVDGLIGADVFAAYVVTIDVPQRQVRLSPLPKRPDEVTATATLDTSGSDAAQTVPHDRYVAPEMKDWTPVFRAGHSLLFPTNINNGPTRLFIMDTGASHEGLISIAAAKEVTKLADSERRVKGISGEVKDVKSADTVTLTFARVREQMHDVPAVDLSHIGASNGVEISGLIGFYTLRELILSIDYRDSLVHVVYDPKHGMHSR